MEMCEIINHLLCGWWASTYSTITFLAEMMEKYGALVLQDIAVEIQYEPETWCDDAEGKMVRYEAYARRFLKRIDKAA
jgi:hypothetical protein